MKKYMSVLVLIGYFFNSGFMCHAEDVTESTKISGSGASIQIRPTTAGEDSIVDAIKYYSNLTESYVSQYKVVKLGDIGTAGAFLLGLSSSFLTGYVAAGVSTGYAGTIQNVLKTNIGRYSLPEGAQKLMQSPAAWVAMGVLGGSYASYKFLYPRTRQGILQKIDQFIAVCRSLERPDTFSIVQIKFNDASYLKSYLPQGWHGSDIRIYKALNNLASQAEYASALLNHIKDASTLLNFTQNVAEIDQRITLIDKYSECLQHNRDLMFAIVQPELTRREKSANVQADTELKQAGKVTLYGAMAKGTVSSIWNGLKELYNHKEMVIALGFSVVITKLFGNISTAIKSK